MILTDEFARQALMETELGIPSALFAPPVREIIELGKSQVSFMNMFAIPLFAGVTDVMPAMQFAVDELNKNVSIWDGRVKEEQELRKQQKVNEDPRHHQMDGMFSPRAMSLAIPATGIGSGSDEMLKQGDSPVLSGSSSGAMAKLTNHIHAKLGQSNLRSMSNLDEISESDTPNGSLEPVTEKDLVQERNGVESEPLIPPFYSTETRSRNSTPDQLQLSFATVSAPGLLEKSGGHSLVTDAVVREPQDTATTMPRPETAGTTEGSHSLPGTSTTATTAHTAAKTGPPLSPSIQRTSFVSNGSLGGGAGSTEPDHLSRSAPAVASHVLSQPTVPSDYKSATASHLTKTTSGTSSADKERGRQPGSAGGGGGGGNMVEKMRTLARKSSRGRFRMSFWKKGSKGEAPPVPSSIVGRGNASFDERA
jgi:3',5'-cyclic-nucleotide phosphodiesterase